MQLSIMDEKDLFVIKLLNYFITKRNYSPIIIHGINNEIWLENPKEEYRIIRIVTRNIYNQEQFDVDVLKAKHIINQLKRKMFTFSMKTLSIITSTGDNFPTSFENEKNYDTIILNDEDDVFRNLILDEYFTDIKNSLVYDEVGFELVGKIMNDISKKNIEESEKRNSMFRKEIPFITYLLIIINVAIFSLMYVYGNGSEDVNTLINFGANYIPLVKQGQIYRIITCSFLHIGAFHLLCNMYALYIVGPQIERFFGRTKYLLIYFMSAIIGSLFTIVLSSPNTVSAGASGAIFGLFGAIMYFGYHYRGYIGNAILNQIIPVVLLNLVISFTTPHIGAAAHIGGLIGGYATSYALGANLEEEQSQKTTGFIILFILIGFLVYMGFFK